MISTCRNVGFGDIAIRPTESPIKIPASRFVLNKQHELVVFHHGIYRSKCESSLFVGSEQLGDKSRNSGISSMKHNDKQFMRSINVQLNSRGPPSTAHKEGHMEIVHCRHDNSAAENLSFSQWYTLVIRRFYRLKSTARETFQDKHDSGFMSRHYFGFWPNFCPNIYIRIGQV